MSAKQAKEAQNPLILRLNRLMDAFTKSDDERDFYLDKTEGFIVFENLKKTEEEIDALEKELLQNPDRYYLIPKLSFYETKKIMEGFVNEKVYDIDTKEKLLDIIQSKEARENFLEFLHDQHTELDKWQQYYVERSRIRIIEWLRKNEFYFVFEEDLDIARPILDKLKTQLFDDKVAKELQSARKTLQSKAKTYYSNEALNPRPKRGRPPKQVAKQEIEPQLSSDIYTTVSSPVRPFLYTPDITSASSITFSAKYESEEELLAAYRKTHASTEVDDQVESLNKKLASLRSMTSRWAVEEEEAQPTLDDEPDEIAIAEIEIELETGTVKKPPLTTKLTKTTPTTSEKANPKSSKPTKKAPAKKTAEPKEPKRTPKKRIMPQQTTKKESKKRLQPLKKLRKTKPKKSD